MWAIRKIQSKKFISPRFAALLTSLGVAGLVVLATPRAFAGGTALNPIPNPPPGSGSYGLEATKTQPPPTQGATITIPGNGASFTSSPITVGGLCPSGLLVQIYDNGVFAGAIDCKNGSFSLQVSLFSGQNDLTAGVFDDLGQAGPISNTVTVNYSNTSFVAFGALITLTSNYGRRSASPNTDLTWPLILSGGSGPYAFSIDWGDGKLPELKSQPSAGNVQIDHVYENPGIYHVTIRVTDVSGESAFLQVVAVANGKPATTGSTDKSKPTTITKVLWIPTLLAFVLLIPTYWLGRRSELVTLRQQLARDAARYQQK